jgi:hypothetical protein
MKHLIASLVLATACGGTDTGGGTRTLLVNGHVDAEVNGSNGTRPQDFTTDFEVRVELNGNIVSTGSVTIEGDIITPLTFDAGDGRWRGSAAGYAEVYRLDVVAGPDEVRGVVVDGPDIHTFKAPLPGASLDSTVPIDVEWDRGDQADSATIRVGDIDRITIIDNGLYVMGPNFLRAEHDQPRENRIELRRTNRVVPAGAVPGSELSVSIENELDVIALANPAL